MHPREKAIQCILSKRALVPVEILPISSFHGKSTQLFHDAAKPEHPKRPAEIQDFIKRLTSSDTDPKELDALRAWSKKMIQVFEKDPSSEFVQEAVELSSATKGKDYEELLRAFGNAIIKGTADGNILDSTLLNGFAHVIRKAQDNISASSASLGSVLRSLERRLKAAKDQAELETQYRLICTLSGVLDAMVDIGVSGLSQEELHGPLLNRLGGDLSKHEELRLAQAASYAYQALLGVPSDESPYRAVLINALKVGNGILKVAGAVWALDPGRLPDAFENLANLPDLINSMVDVIGKLHEVCSGAQNRVEGMKLQPRQKAWYVALRYTGPLIRAGKLKELEEYIQKIPCSGDKKYLCGLLMQLESYART